ncbi:zinc-binding dehydrogenase [Rhodococcus sovatensis]|uniref:Alcohol dehydrogenase catalytic domain-containing protein n=1 Tax=Rhodococcus sovatensis TaxID=1805840 RepID=A0ABZ2PIW7_9NOCA
MTIISAAAVFNPSDSALRMTELTVRAPRRGEVLVRIKSACVCHSDLHMIDGDWEKDSKRYVGGHEAAGVIEQLGDGTTGVQTGDHVVLSWFAACGTCRKCAAGKPWLCSDASAGAHQLPDGTTATTDVDGEPTWPVLGLGAFSQFVVVPMSAVVVVPRTLPFEVAALIGCAVTTGIGAVIHTAEVEFGSAAVVIGCGGVGQSVIMGLSMIGADPIIAVDLDPDRRVMAEALGATLTLDGADPELRTKIFEATDGGADYVFEAVGLESTIQSSPDLLTSGGAVVLVGMTPAGVTARIDPLDLTDRSKRIIGCHYGSGNPAVDFPLMARMYASGKLPLDRLIGSVRPLSEINEALADLKNATGLRTVLVP